MQPHTAYWLSTPTELPRMIRNPLLAAWFSLALGAGALAVWLVEFWGTRTDYADRFLILVGSAVIAWRLGSTAPISRPLAILSVTLAVFVALLLPAAAYLQTQAAGGRTVLLWLDAFVLILGAAAVLLAEGGWARLRHFGFPLVFPLFALPIPSRVLSPLQLQLQTTTTDLAAWTLPKLGIPLTRELFLLRLPGGDLGVAETCSGVQSLTALLALAAFLAFYRGFGPFRGCLLVLLAIPVVLLVNGLRVVFSGLIQEGFGRRYIRDEWHDSLGFALVFVGLGFIVGLAKCLGSPVGLEVPKVSGSASGRNLSRRTSAILALLLFLGLASAGELLLRGSERAAAVERAAQFESIPMNIEDWRGQEQPVNEEITALLGQDRILHRSYENNLGERVSVWVIYWSSAKLVKGYHHPDVCLGNGGFRANERWMETVALAGGGSVAATAREFRRGERESQFVLYWTQEGNRIWTDADEREAQKETGLFAEPGWIADAVHGRTADPVGRMVVLIGANGSSAFIRGETLRFARRFAGELYAVCPWAKPE